MRPYTSCKVTVHNILYGCINTSATEYGIQTEQQTLMQLQMEIKKKINKCGLFVDKNIPFLAATPGEIVHNLVYY